MEPWLILALGLLGFGVFSLLVEYLYIGKHEMTREAKIFIGVFLITFFVPLVNIFILIPLYYGHTPSFVMYSHMQAYVTGLFVMVFLIVSFTIASLSVIIYQVYKQIRKRRRID